MDIMSIKVFGRTKFDTVDNFVKHFVELKGFFEF